MAGSSGGSVSSGVSEGLVPSPAFPFPAGPLGVGARGSRPSGSLGVLPRSPPRRASPFRVVVLAPRRQRTSWTLFSDLARQLVSRPFRNLTGGPPLVLGDRPGTSSLHSRLRGAGACCGGDLRSASTGLAGGADQDGGR